MDILETLSGGDRRSIGKSGQVVAYVLSEASRLGVVIDGLSHGNALIRMRCADAAEKVSGKHPDWLQPFKDALIDVATHSTQQEVRWHMAQMLPRLDLSPREKQTVIALLFGYLNDESRIVKTFAMTALADFASVDVGLRQRLIPTLKKLVRSGSPAVQSRGRKLLAHLRND